MKQMVLLLVVFTTFFPTLSISSVTRANEEVNSADADEASPGIVHLGEKQLFSIKTRAGSFSPKFRAKAVSQRLEEFIADKNNGPRAITLREENGIIDILGDKHIILSITEDDAKAEKTTKNTLARSRRASIEEAVASARGQKTKLSFFIHLGLSVLLTLSLVAIMFANKFLFALFFKKLENLKSRSSLSIRIKSFELLTSDRTEKLVSALARITQSIVTLSLFYFYVPLVLSIFPGTSKWATRLYGYIFNPLRSLFGMTFDFIPNLFSIVVIGVVTRYLLKLVHIFFDGVGSGALEFNGFHRDWAEPTYKLVRFLVFSFALVAVFPYLPGSSSPAFQGVSVFIGVLFSLGSSSSIGNMVAGMVLTYMNAFRIGDRVKIADTCGDVIEKSILVTRIRTIKNEDITIPNSIVLGSHIVNYSSLVATGGSGLILSTEVTVGYQEPWKKIEKLLIDAASETLHTLKDPKPFVLHTRLDDFYARYEINVYTRSPNLMAQIYSNLNKNIQDKFLEFGIEMTNPHYFSTNIQTVGQENPASKLVQFSLPSSKNH